MISRADILLIVGIMILAIAGLFVWKKLQKPMNRLERTRCLNIMNEYYRLHLPDFPVLKSLEVLKELFD